MSLIDDIIEIGVLQEKVADETRYKCTCALMQHEKIDFHTAVEKLNFSPAETERVRNLLAASNQQFVDSQITYKGYVGTVSFSEQDHVYYGKVLDIPDLVSYEGATLEELTADFQDAVNDYLTIIVDRNE